MEGFSALFTTNTGILVWNLWVLESAALRPPPPSSLTCFPLKVSIWLRRTLLLVFSLLPTIAGLVLVLVWAYLLLHRGRFWKVSANIAAANIAASSHQRCNGKSLQGSVVPIGDVFRADGRVRVVAIIPARNEADLIGRSVVSLLAPGCLRDSATEESPLMKSFRVLVVDDGSDDGTATAARAAVEMAGLDSTVTILPGAPLESGWSGKLWALRQGIEAARHLDPQFLLLTDADVVHSPRDLQALVDVAQAGSYDLASLMVRLHCESLAERLLIPAFVFFFFKLYPPSWIRDPLRSNAGAAGGCLLIRPHALERIGGLESIRHEVIDDCALAQAVKRSGGKVWLGLAQESASVRAYESHGKIGAMISRTAFNQLRHSTALLGAAILGLAFLYWLPVGLVFGSVFSGRPLSAGLGLLAWGLMMAAYLPMVKFYRLNPAWAATLPCAALYYAGATLHSAWQYWRGRGGGWKSKVQDPVR